MEDGRGSWKGKQGVRSAIVVLSRVTWELRKALDADTSYMCSNSLHGGGVYTRTSGPRGAPILLRLEMLSRVYRALQHRGIRDPGLSVRGVFFPLWFWLLIRIALCL